MTHLTPDELIDAMDGVLTPARRGHLDTCVHCRQEAASLHAVMGDLRSADVPEPSPLFWNHLSARVRGALDEQPMERRTRWFAWPVLAPIAGLSLVIAALVGALAGLPPAGTPAPTEIATNQIGDTLEVEAEWALLAELVEDLDADAADEHGLMPPYGAADVAVSQLSLVEQQELLRLLREELRAGG